jgi:hypothetical protein
MAERLCVNRKAKLKSKSVALSPEGFALFGEPQLLEGENVEAYHELLTRIRAAIKPVDIIDYMFIADVAALEWEVLRWRRMKTSLVRALGLAALEEFLAEKLDYNLCLDRFTDSLTEILQENVREDQSEDFAQLSRACAEDEPDAVDKVNKILENTDFDVDHILQNAQTDEAKEIVQRYVRHEPAAVRLVDELLVDAGTSMDVLVVNALAEKLDDIERIDRLTAVAEARRNVSLREIDRRRAALGETLRRTVHEIEDGEFELIEPTPAKEKKRLESYQQP